jgi:hyperosmotically inducible periplasmic protein
MNKHPFNKMSLSVLFMAAALATCFSIGMPAIASDDASLPQAHSDSIGAAIADADITARVKLKLADVYSLKHSDISVTTTNGVVTLTGMASSSDASTVAKAVTMGVQGVKDVDDELKTPSSSKLEAETKDAAATTEHAVSDSWITTKVKSELLADNVTKGFEVNVVTTHGVVVLTGRLANRDAIAHVKDIVEKVDGVKSVDTTDLTVSDG